VTVYQHTRWCRWWPWGRLVAPAGVMLTLTDGEQIGPLPLRYNGRCRHGDHQWLALAAQHLAQHLDSCTVEVLPPRTELSIVFLPDEMMAEALGSSMS